MLTKDENFLFSYDDGASIISTRREVILDTEIWFGKMTWLGLNIHKDDENKWSKAEAVDTPCRSEIKSRIENYEKSLTPLYTPSFLDITV